LLSVVLEVIAEAVVRRKKAEVIPRVPVGEHQVRLVDKKPKVEPLRIQQARPVPSNRLRGQAGK
jgi:hypothetical protein